MAFAARFTAKFREEKKAKCCSTNDDKGGEGGQVLYYKMTRKRKVGMFFIQYCITNVRISL